MNGTGWCLAALRTWLIALVLIPAAQAAAASVPVLEVRGAIGPASAGYIIRGIAKAGAAGAPLVVVELDTPGGLDTSMRSIIQAILASPVPVAVFVGPEGARAASAGTYILYAAHVAAMAPATTLGAATPVPIGLPGAAPRPPPAERAPPPEASKDAPAAKPPLAPADAMTAKQVNDAAAFIRGLAQSRGRNADWAERAVREAVTLTSSEALDQKVIDVVAADVRELLDAIDGRTVRTHHAEVKLATRGLAFELHPPDWRERLLAVIANPSFALILMMLGIYGLLFEFSSPGFGVPGVVGAICLLLALFAFQLLPVNYAGLALILLGVALLAAEVVTPSFGVLGVGGIVAFVAGALLLFDRDVPGFGIPLALIIGLAASSAVLILAGGHLAMRARRRPVVSGVEEMVGSRGVVFATGTTGRWGQVHGERWQIESNAPLVPGQTFRVVGVRGLTLQVVPESDNQGDSR